MLSHLYIRDFTIIHKLELAFAPGFTVLTGETGAGKSILVDALALILGARGDAGVIRHGCARAEIAASFDLAAHEDAAQWLAEHDLYADQECALRRIIEHDKGSRGFINGRPAPIQMLRELGERLVDIHGQHEHQSLLKRDAQRQILDDYAGLGATVADLGSRHAVWKAMVERLETLKHQSADRAARIELLRYQVQELQALGLAADEYPRLEEEHARLANGVELLQGVQAVAAALDDDEGAVSQVLARAIARLESLGQYDARLAPPAQLLSEAAIQANEAAAQLRHYADALDLDPQRLQWLDERLATAHDLARKYHVPPPELTAVLERARTELGDVEDFDVNLARLEEGVAAARAAYREQAVVVSARRAEAGARLSREIAAHMQELGMPGGCFEIQLIALDEAAASATGLERVEFLVSANPGQPLKPLNKVASGGELSRVSLALQVAAAGAARIPTLIFDEVDVGIGGRVAEIVGQRLRALGRSRQVLCITHLAQVAAQGGHHLQVAKTTQDGATYAHVHPLTPEARVHEIARMIGGVEISQQTLAHAEEMLNRVSA